MEYFQRTLEIDISEDNKMGMLYSYLNLAGVQADLRENSSAMSSFRQAENLALETQALPLLGQVYRGLSKVYENEGNYRESLNFHKKFKEVHDSVFDDNKMKQLEELQARFESEKREKEIKMLSQENEIGQLKISQQRGQITVLTLVLILIIGTGAFLFYSNRQKHLAALQEERIRLKEVGMKAVFTAQEEERKRIAKDLHDGIGQTLSGLRLSWAGLSGAIGNDSPGRAEQLNELTVILDDACQEVRTISHQMMPRQLSESGLVPTIRDMLEKSLGKSDIKYNFEHFGIDRRFDENVEIALYRISQELVNNVIKHSGASRVALQLVKSRNYLVLIVEDNGKGFDLKEKSTGIGLLNIASRIDTINGEINYEPSPESGTIATVRVPVGN
ncbi:MAG: sensor histidine kinase [Bacteroidales bacterium]|nr:sensor histidine kinase [Bacteroidales bacterium]